MITVPNPARFPFGLAALGAAATVALIASPALAHEGDPSGGFTSGVSHPISGLDHVVAMIAVGLWGSQLGRPAIWLLPVTFPLVMAVGGFLGLVEVPLPGVEIGIAASAIVLGAMVLAAAKPPLWVALTLVAVFALFHGHAHGTELPSHERALWYSIGFVIATGLLHLAGIAIGTVGRWKAGRVSVRGAGAVVALAGAWFLWGAIA